MSINKKKLGLVLGPISFAFILVLFNPDDLNYPAKAVLASSVWVAIWWITEAMPIAVSALLPTHFQIELVVGSACSCSKRTQLSNHISTN